MIKMMASNLKGSESRIC